MKAIHLILFFSLTLTSCNKEIKETDNVTKKKTIQPGISKNNLKTADNKSFEKTVYSVIEAFRKNDEVSIAEFVSSDGVVVIYRTGVFNEYKWLKKIVLKRSDPGIFPYHALKAGYKLEYGTLPRFNCGEMQWDKHGLYCDTIARNTLLSGTPQNLIKYRGDKIPAEEIDKLKNLEGNSRRIVLAHPGEGFIFYLKLINNKWYLTALDRITTDCSA